MSHRLITDRQPCSKCRSTSSRRIAIDLHFDPWPIVCIEQKGCERREEATVRAKMGLPQRKAAPKRAKDGK